MLPPDLAVGSGDGGVNSPPAILSVSSEQQDLPEPGPVTIERGTGLLSVVVYDTDIEDSLYVRIFVNYEVTDPTPPRSTCTATPNGTAQRRANCSMGALCQEEEVGADPSAMLMQVQVFDRVVLDSGVPTFKAMDPGGLTTSRFYQMRCLAAGS